MSDEIEVIDVSDPPLRLPWKRIGIALGAILALLLAYRLGSRRSDPSGYDERIRDLEADVAELQRKAFD